MKKVKLTTPYIKLNQLLKYMNIVETGGMAKVMIQNGMVKVNEKIVLQRGKKIKPGDIVEIKDCDTIKVE